MLHKGLIVILSDYRHSYFDEVLSYDVYAAGDGKGAVLLSKPRMVRNQACLVGLIIAARATDQVM